MNLLLSRRDELLAEESNAFEGHSPMRFDMKDSDSALTVLLPASSHIMSISDSISNFFLSPADLSSKASVTIPENPVS